MAAAAVAVAVSAAAADESTAAAGGVEQEQQRLPVMKFGDGYRLLTPALKASFESDNWKLLEETFLDLVTQDTDNKKLLTDQVLREYLTNELLASCSKVDIPRCQRYVKFVIQIAQELMCSPVTPIQVLSDMFDIITLSHCEQLFKIVEQEVATWRQDLFFTPCKNNLLRICNDLLRRLSRTQNTVFCGRILLFLAKFFPFSERSGLNVISEFNLDNITTFSKPAPKPKPDPKPEVEKDEGMGEEMGEEMELELEVDLGEKEKEEGGDKGKTTAEKLNAVLDEELHILAVDEEYELYSKFWQIQDFFRSPSQCYDKGPWKTFSHHLSEILAIFQKNKLDVTGKAEDTLASGAKAVNGGEEVEQYFAKYLTNQNLLQLQLSDSNFRRYILVQILILFQFLQTSVKFKTEKMVLNGDQSKWIDDNRKKVLKLLGETHPHGPEFATSVKHLLKREMQWNKWKNDGCPSFALAEGVDKMVENGEKIGELPASRPLKRKARLGDLMRKEHQEKRINLGSKGLTKLWSMNPDNLESCQSSERDFLPSLENFFEDAIMEIDPKNQVEKMYRKVYNGEWGWRALRLMSRRSMHFFISGNNPIGKLPEYLESMLGKMGKEMPHLNKVTENGTADNGVDAAGDKGDCEAASNGDSKPVVVTSDQIEALSDKLASHWKALLPKMGLSEEKVEEVKKLESDKEICKSLLEGWIELEGEGATQDELNYILQGLKLAHVIEGVL